MILTCYVCGADGDEDDIRLCAACDRPVCEDHSTRRDWDTFCDPLIGCPP